jgi:hypothetical protein
MLLLFVVSQCSQVIALPLAVWLLHAQVFPPIACACAALAAGHVIRAVSNLRLRYAWQPFDVSCDCDA